MQYILDDFAKNNIKLLFVQIVIFSHFYFAVLTDYMGPAYKLYGPIIRVWVVFFPMFIVLDPSDLQVVLSSKKHTDKIFFYKFLHNFLGTGLITSNGKFGDLF